VKNNQNNNQKNTPKLGEIYFADLPYEGTSIQAGIRPVVIMQEEKAIRNSTLVCVMPLTSEIKALHLPVHVVIKKSSENGLSKDSMALAESLRCIPKENVKNNKKIGTLEQEYFPCIGKALMSQYPMTQFVSR
jgi:mRNA interferase MazF